MKDKRRRRYLIGANRPRFYRYLVVAGSKKPPPNPCRIADCGGSPSSCRSAVPKDFCSWHGSSAPAKELERPVRRLDGGGSARAPNCLLIRTVALDVQSALGPSGQNATIGMSQRSANVRSRKGALVSLQRHGCMPRRRLRPIWADQDGQKSRTPAAARPASASAGCHRFRPRCKKIHPVGGQGG
jgi:hypothetical protein